MYSGRYIPTANGSGGAPNRLTRDGILLASDVETTMPVASETVTLNLQIDGAPASVELASAPLDGETEGSSRFAATGDAVPEAIHDAEDLHGAVVVEIDGKQYRGEIMHDHAHDDEHDHDHAHDDDPADEGHTDGEDGEE